MSKRSVGIGLCLLMFSFSLISPAPTSDPDLDLSDDKKVNNVILPANQTNIPGHQEGSIFTDTTLSSGQQHTCAILDNGELKCWGRDQYGQLGDDMSSANQLSPVSIDFGTGRTAVAISADYYRTCAILDNGDLKCWGRGDNGQLGIGTTNDEYTPPSTPIDLGPGRTAVAVDGGFMHVCAILDNGDLKCWGQNFAGELGIYIPSIGNNNPTKSIP